MYLRTVSELKISDVISNLNKQLRWLHLFLLIYTKLLLKILFLIVLMSTFVFNIKIVFLAKQRKTK